MKIINSSPEKTKKTKMTPDMLNLLGCNKENFKKLLKKMGYKIIDIENETFFKYNASKNYKRTINKKTSKESPFGILKELNLS